MELTTDEFDTGMSWLCMANPFPPDLWGYVHGLCYQPAQCLVKGLIVPLAYYTSQGKQSCTY